MASRKSKKKISRSVKFGVKKKTKKQLKGGKTVENAKESEGFIPLTADVKIAKGESPFPPISGGSSQEPVPVPGKSPTDAEKKLDSNYNKKDAGSHCSDTTEASTGQPVVRKSGGAAPRTLKFQEALIKSYSDKDVLGSRLSGRPLSREVAYKIFKESFDTMVEFVRLDEEKKLPLAGIGTFSIAMTPPRKPVKGGVSKLSEYEAIPHLKWKPSDRYRIHLLEAILGYKVKKS